MHRIAHPNEFYLQMIHQFYIQLPQEALNYPKRGYFQKRLSLRLTWPILPHQKAGSDTFFSWGRSSREMKWANIKLEKLKQSHQISTGNITIWGHRLNKHIYKQQLIEPNNTSKRMILMFWDNRKPENMTNHWSHFIMCTWSKKHPIKLMDFCTTPSCGHLGQIYNRILEHSKSMN